MQNFSLRVLAWFDVHGRKSLPWQQNVSAYKTWVSEIMLQQTQVATVIPYFNRFIAHFPEVITLANAEQDTVLAYWSGLGYYSRARNLHKTAQIIRDRHNGIFPDEIESVIALPGIGKSTAGAILSLAYKQRHAILDGNVKRVLSRHQLLDGIPNQSATLKKQWAVAEKLTPQIDCDKYTQAMMDLGAMICTRTKPQCNDCPVQADCGAYQTDRIADYPNKRPKKILPEKKTTMLIITDGTQVYLEKRPDKGIWGGLWSLPEIDKEINEEADKKTISAYLSAKERNAVTIGKIEKTEHSGNYTHTFTHYRLQIQLLTVRVSSLTHGFSAANCQQMGLPTPVRKILESIIQ